MGASRYFGYMGASRYFGNMPSTETTHFDIDFKKIALYCGIFAQDKNCEASRDSRC
jgi:hypothetical protein